MPEQMKTGFGLMVATVLCPPLYFFLRGKTGVGLVHSCIYLLALLTVFVLGIGVIFWAIGYVHAQWDLAHVKREELAQRQATLFAEKLAERQVP